MKTFLNPKNLPLLTMITAVLGFFLRLIIVTNGPDSRGLYEVRTVEWILFLTVTVLLMVLNILMTRPLKVSGTYEKNYPASPISATGSLLGAVGILLAAVPYLQEAKTTFPLLTGATGLLAGVSLFCVSLARLRGEKPFFLSHIAVSSHMALRIFEASRMWSNETQSGLFLISFMTVGCLFLASYYLSTFDVDMGMRRQSIFWSLLSVHLCVTSLADAANPRLTDWTGLVFFGGCAIWLLTNLCCLLPLKEQTPAQPEEPEEPEDFSAVEAFLREPD